MADVPEEIKDLQSNVALGMLQDITKSGKISPELGELTKAMFVRLHDTIVQTFQNHKILWAKAKALKNMLNTEKSKLEEATNKQIQAQDYLEQMQSKLKKADGEHEMYEHKIDVLNYELEDLEHEKMNKDLKLKEDQKEARLRIQPSLELLNNEIENLKNDLTSSKTQIEKEQRDFADIREKISMLHKENDEKANEMSQLNEEMLKIKDDPLRFSKNADMLSNANTLMNNDLQQILDDNAKKEKILNELRASKEEKMTKLKECETMIKMDQDKIKIFVSEITDYRDEKNKNIERLISLKTDRIESENLRIAVEKELRRMNDSVNSFKKMTDHEKKKQGKQEKLKRTLEDDIVELRNSYENGKREEKELKALIAKQQAELNKIQDDMKLTKGESTTTKDKCEQREEEEKKIEKEIEEKEKEINELRNIESQANKTVSNLTAMRESMARKASSAMAEVRETKEELKIKELLILDLRKKQQETEFKLNNYKALYEEVKSARNKYVNMIQSSSQELAQLKEKIKILQNELEILKNESSEKDRTLMEYKLILQMETHRRDRRHAKLNKLEYQKKQRKEIVEQNFNEIQKLNMVIMALEKEMLDLKRKYELACESRNYTGIQLIDRNDELCILYEKSNINENILKNGEMEIKKLEDEIRMIKIEINEVMRKIDVTRKQIDEVPKLADRVIQLKNELDAEKEKEKRLADELEDPLNKNRLRDLKGEDPDQEALEAKIQVLEERLNGKKESLLEKELILDEITNLSEKLRKQALDGRQTTLELSEKVNDFQARLKDLTRKMMSTISELSMFQATALKLQNEREGLENLVEESKQRVDQGLPPTQESEIEYQKMLRDRLRHQEERDLRVQRETIERSIPPFATKTSAEPRVGAYIPDDHIGISKPYGKNAPFKPSELGANMRFYRKPKQQEIEI